MNVTCIYIMPLPSWEARRHRRALLLRRNQVTTVDLRYDIEMTVEGALLPSDVNEYNTEELSHENYRRNTPSIQDWAAALMIFKTRRSQNNKDMDYMCRLLRINPSSYCVNVPKSWAYIRRCLTNDDSLSLYQNYYYCPVCITLSSTESCACGVETTATVSYSSIIKQIQQILSIKGTYTRMCEMRDRILQMYSYTDYVRILQLCPESSFTLTVNSDGIEVWPFMLAFNELPLSERFSLRNIVLPLIWPTGTSPKYEQIHASIKLMVDELLQLENGYDFFIPELDSTKTLYFFTIASCSDKPAQSKMENVNMFMAEYGCGLCYTSGALYDFYTKTIRRSSNYTC
ncbi:unnamed protein product [Didymodactylos carnosus]|uniref:Uncharacterized protein n=1 Tax=Didymodactylos carnosus TaxID=1234261 RepID=A0A8S2EYX7_9BILA|nr:unnamed protein product [Didymodactylos carnosus]CAF4080760.1 unnamed protein product [Didymodactylos carnosus]